MFRPRKSADSIADRHLIAGQIRPRKKSASSLCSRLSGRSWKTPISKDKTHFDISRRCSQQRVHPRNGSDELSTRVFGSVCPIGKGTRGLISGSAADRQDRFDAKAGQRPSEEYPRRICLSC